MAPNAENSGLAHYIPGPSFTETVEKEQKQEHINEQRRRSAEAEIRWRLAIMKAPSVQAERKGRLPVSNLLTTTPSSLRRARASAATSINTRATVARRTTEYEKEVYWGLSRYEDLLNDKESYWKLSRGSI
ncbi:hypothetical protein CAPTEDRAFT_190848 [Capitella teleta]|uniref:Uncharacterized protein n=1 Tax=Capitella teleta TaxID=283909 RepID=R7VAF2_CAPTE|nr:hypothetical protein CAPTEDRAFT_190848 [Capitella teleta]|eukprot:ELU13316.1 hypothetical protein CAPTEDRAFT_190848 [Capitella teleta]